MTLADHLRGLPDTELADLLCARPDLAVPVPGDFSAMATRAQSRLSVVRALEQLDQFTLEILDALRLAGPGPVPFDEVATLAAGQASPERTRRAVQRLRRAALVHGTDDGLHVVGAVEECCSPYPAGLGRPAAELDAAAGALAADPAALRQALDAAPEAARQVLARLAAGPPIGTVTGARRPAPDDPSPVRWLIARHLLVPIDDDTVELPRELGLLLRHEPLRDEPGPGAEAEAGTDAETGAGTDAETRTGTEAGTRTDAGTGAGTRAGSRGRGRAGAGPLGVLHPEPPPLDPPVRELSKVDAAGAGQAMEAVRQVEALLDALTDEPAPVLRSGGMGVRELRRLARATGVEEPVAGLLLEVAAAAGLVDDDREVDPRWLPTAGYDSWRETDLATRWTRLAAAWWSMSRQPALVGQRDDRDRPVNVLSGEVERIAAPTLRRAALACLAELPAGTAPGPAELATLLAWQAPRRGGRHRDQAVDWALSQAAALGVTGLGALTSYGAGLLSDGPDEAAAALGKLLPEPIEHVMVQADLTVVVPGPPEPSLAAELSLVADPESAGGASVYRVTAATVRRALDAGLAADELHSLFERRSVTPVPQALRYLVDDAARSHGGIRVGSAGGYLRGDDEARLAEILADRRLEHLALRRIAPTVLVTPYAPARLLATLREYGYAPVPEDAAGTVVLTRPELPRAPARPRPPRTGDELATVDRTRALAVIEAVRQGDQTTRRTRRAPVTRQPGSVTETLAVLREALRTGGQVWVGYVDSHGGDASRLVRPVSMASGYLRAEDPRTDMVHTFALHRVTSATPA